ncbi:MAG: OsmC family peroxiredoxin, partial [Gammaproteobacteria bacterium]
MSDPSGFCFDLEWDGGYAFRVDYDRPKGLTLTVDEPAPLGADRGPNPARMLATAVAHCLSSSLLYCLSRSHVEVRSLRARVKGQTVRNEAGRLRIGGIRVA